MIKSLGLANILEALFQKSVGGATQKPQKANLLGSAFNMGQSAPSKAVNTPRANTAASAIAAESEQGALDPLAPKSEAITPLTTPLLTPLLTLPLTAPLTPSTTLSATTVGEKGSAEKKTDTRSVSFEKAGGAALTLEITKSDKADLGADALIQAPKADIEALLAALTGQAAPKADTAASAKQSKTAEIRGAEKHVAKRSKDGIEKNSNQKEEIVAKAAESDGNLFFPKEEFAKIVSFAIAGAEGKLAETANKTSDGAIGAVRLASGEGETKKNAVEITRFSADLEQLRGLLRELKNAEKTQAPPAEKTPSDKLPRPAAFEITVEKAAKKPAPASNSPSSDIARLSERAAAAEKIDAPLKTEKAQSFAPAKINEKANAKTENPLPTVAEKPKSEAPMIWADAPKPLPLQEAGQAAEEIAPQNADLKSRLDDMAQLAAGDSKKIIIHLTPESLGTVQIVVEKNEDGVIVVHAKADTKESQQHIDNILGDIKQNSSDKNIQVEYSGDKDRTAYDEQKRKEEQQFAKKENKWDADQEKSEKNKFEDLWGEI